MANIDEALFRDITHIRDFERTSTGDLGLIEGLANVRNALLHRLVTEPGTLIHRPEYGVGIKRYLNAPNQTGFQRELAFRIRDQFLRDPRVEQVLGVQVKNDETNVAMTKILVRVKIIGYTEQELAFLPYGNGV